MSAILNYTSRNYLTTKFARTVTTRLIAPSSAPKGKEGGYKVWRNITLFLAFPSICLAALNCGHIEHSKPEDYVKYDYMCIRTKRFPWKDGNCSFFHNPKINVLPDAY